MQTCLNVNICSNLALYVCKGDVPETPASTVNSNGDLPLEARKTKAVRRWLKPSVCDGGIGQPTKAPKHGASGLPKRSRKEYNVLCI